MLWFDERTFLCFYVFQYVDGSTTMKYICSTPTIKQKMHTYAQWRKVNGDKFVEKKKSLNVVYCGRFSKVFQATLI